MPFKDIVVYLDATPDCRGRLLTAIAFAERHEARLIGVDVSTKEAYEGEERDVALALEEDFTNAVEARGLDFRFHAVAPDAYSAEELFAHSADLLISTQPHPDRHHLINKAIPREVLTASGVPMLVLPTGWTGGDAIGEDVVIAYNFSREATRAVHDAMPILTMAKQVFVFVFADNYSDENIHLQALRDHLGRHGVSATLNGWRDRGETDMISALFAGLDKELADLIVSGAYGHSTFFEEMFGGATQKLIKNVSMPLLMSH